MLSQEPPRDHTQAPHLGLAQCAHCGRIMLAATMFRAWRHVDGQEDQVQHYCSMPCVVAGSQRKEE